MHKQDSVYFEQERIWQRDLDPGEKTAIELLAQFWPSDAKSLVDVGAGAGRLLNALDFPASRFACDLSLTALKQVQSPAAVALATMLPFADRAFDASLCSNVLEHLTNEDLALAFAELDRVSARYIIIISPVDEPLETQLTICRNCGCQYHPNRHRRRFSAPDFAAALPGFATERVAYFGLPFMRPTMLAASIERALGNDIHHYPGSLCPNCDAVMPEEPLPTRSGPQLWDIGLSPASGADAHENMPSSVLVLLKRKELGMPLGLPPGKIRVASPGGAPVAQADIRRYERLAVDFSQRFDYLPTIAAEPFILTDPASAWRDVIPGLLSLEGSPTADLYANIGLPVREMLTCSELLISVSGDLSEPIAVEIYDTVVGYRHLGELTTPTAQQGMHDVILPLPALLRPGGVLGLLRFFVPQGARGVLHLHRLCSPESAQNASVPDLTRTDDQGLVAFDDLAPRGATALVVSSQQALVEVEADAGLVGCASGILTVGAGQSVHIPLWLGQERPPLLPVLADLPKLALALRGGADGQRVHEALSDGSVRALVDLPGIGEPKQSELWERIAALSDALSRTERQRDVAEKTLTERDRTIFELGNQVTHLNELVNELERRRLAAEGMAVQRDDIVAKLVDTERRRDAAEKMLTERDRTIFELGNQVTHLNELLNELERRRAATEGMVVQRDGTVAELTERVRLLDKALTAASASAEQAER